MSATAPSIWSGGVEWGTAVTSGAAGYWQASDSPSTYSGAAVCSVAIAAKWKASSLMAASWSVGASDWLAPLSPTTATLTFVGTVSATATDDVVITTVADSSTPTQHPAARWVGRVDSIAVRTDSAGKTWTTINAADLVASLGRAKGLTTLPDYFLTSDGYHLVPLIEATGRRAGVPLRASTLDYFLASPLGPATGLTQGALDLINEASQMSNALLVMRGDGKLFAIRRDQQVSPPGSTTLSPVEYTIGQSADDIIDSWDISNPGDWVHTYEVRASVDRYGQRQYALSSDLMDSTGAIAVRLRPPIGAETTPNTALGTNEVLAAPRTRLLDSAYVVTDLSNSHLRIEPGDRITVGSQDWQAMTVTHDVAPGAGNWHMVITGEQVREVLFPYQGTEA